MSLQVEKLENNKAKLTIEVSAEEFDAAIEQAYQKNKGKMSVPGFRKGKVPRQMLEKMYGVGVFYEDAVNALIPEAYAKEVENCEEEIVSQPSIDVVQVEKGKPFIFTAVVALKPEVKLGKYKGLKIEKESAEVTDEELTAELDRVREQNSRTIPVEDRAVENGDVVTVDYEGFVDGVAFEGGKGTDYPLTIGSHTFIDTFEEQLIGKNIGDDVEVNVTFPEEYHAEELKGKAAMFKVAIKEIKAKELPELDDDFAQDVSEFDTLDEYKEDVKKKLAEKKEKQIKTEVENKAIEMIIEDAKMDIPEEMVDEQVKQMAEDFARRLQGQGLDIEQYFKFTGLTPQKMLEDMRPQAVKRIQSRLVLEAVAEAEKLEVTDEEVDKEIEEMAAMYQMEADKLKELIGDREKASMKKDIAVQKAVDFVVASVK
ncbi:MAG: trigger factor [Lachnospiraceae bacterium]|nr:trigger factor [Lachnospiraceae bacterium]